MKVLDLFSGLKGWSTPWADRGHETFAIDIDRRFDADAYIDISNVHEVLEILPWQPDVILASPPCNAFSVMSMARNWTHSGEPKTLTAVIGQRLVLATLKIVNITKPRYWVLENPRARLRTLDLLDNIPRYTVTYCQYGEDRMKPTDLWGVLPESLVLRPMCKNGDPCHVRAPRGSRTGTQGGVDSIRSAMIPYELSKEICLAAERDYIRAGLV